MPAHRPLTRALSLTGSLVALSIGLPMATASTPAGASRPSETASETASASSTVIPFTAADVTETTAGSYDITWSAPSSAGTVRVYAGTNPLVDATTDEVGSGGHSATIVVRPPSTPAARWYFTLTPSKGEPLVVADRSLHMADDPNLRDVGGYRTPDGQWVRMGVLYRSGALNNLSPAETQELSALGVTTVFDLRTDAERAATTDRLPAGADYVVANVLAGSTNDANVTLAASQLLDGPDKASATVAQARGIMAGLYDQLPVLASADAAYRSLFTAAAGASPTHAVLFHCTAGKDRTGWATAALLLELGVPMASVEQDYLLSNQYVLPYYKSVVSSYVAQGGKASVVDAVLGVQPQYLEDSLAVMKSHYGSVQAYFSEGLGLTPNELAELRSTLLEGTPQAR